MKRLLIITFMVLILCGFASARQTESFVVDVPDIKIKDGEKHSFSIENYGKTVDMYRPSVPVKKYYYKVPSSATGISVVLSRSKKNNLENVKKIEKTKPPLPAKGKYTPPEKKPPKHSIYPRKSYRLNGIKKLNGHKLISLTIYPVQYHRNKNKVETISEYEFKISYNQPALRRPHTKTHESDTPLAKEMIANYDSGTSTVSSTQDTTSTSDTSTTSGTSSIDGLPYTKYAIITTDELQPALKDFAEWKNNTGEATNIFTMQEIYGNYSGRDNAEKIRNFLIELENNHDIRWVLLVGDTSDVPARNAYVPDGYADDGDYTPTDYYYADLKGSYSPYDWDYDDDGKFGETEDQLDWMPEAYVGRIPSSDYTTVQNYMDYIVNYEKNPNTGSWQNRAILAGAKSDDQTDEALLMEYVKNDTMQNMNTEKLYYLNNYEKDYDLDFANFEGRTGNGASIVNWAGHGSYTSIHVTSSGSSFASTSTNPSNGEMRPFVYADACNNGGFDQSPNLAMDVLKKWGSGFAGASRVSWYAQGWSGPSDPWNQAHDYRFFEQLMQKYKPGQALYDSKVDYINDFSSSYHPSNDNASRKNLLSYNLLGDPEMSVWTDKPTDMNLTHTKSFVRGEENKIHVKVSSGSAIENAKVALNNKKGVFTYGFTNSTGQITFQIAPEASNKITVTATKHNFIPGQSYIEEENNTVNVTADTNGSYVNPGEINFSYNISSYSSIDRCILNIDGETVLEDTSVIQGKNVFSWQEPYGGNLSWKINCFDEYNRSNQMQPKETRVVMMTEYNTTNLSSSDLENITNLVLEKEETGGINYSESVNLSGGADIDRHVEINHNNIEVNSDKVPELNKKAILTLNDVNYSEPVIVRDGQSCTDCSIIEKGENYIKFSVEHFSSYRVAESNANIGSSGTFNGTKSASGVLAGGGNVTNVDLAGNYSTSSWQGFYGNTTAELSLGVGTEVFYDFGLSNVTAVYASTNPGFEFNNLSGGGAEEVDSLWSLKGSEKASNVFSNSFDPGWDTTNATLMADENFRAYLANQNSTDTKDDFVFGGIVNNTGEAGFDGGIYNYELMVPVNSSETYYFFISI